jgi:hypothetical protein
MLKALGLRANLGLRSAAYRGGVLESNRGKSQQ